MRSAAQPLTTDSPERQEIPDLSAQDAAAAWFVHELPRPDGPESPLKPKRKWRRWVPRALAGLLLAFFLLLGWLAVTAPLSRSLKPIVPPEITLLATDGTPIARSGAIVERPVQISKLPAYVPHAFIAIEDRRFYHHWGIDPRGIARAAWSDLTGGRTEGGSTITQQLAKFNFLNSERSLGRKAREMLIAFWLEAWLTKDQILERYLSNAYFGDNTYGLRAASLHYFNRQPENLSVSQAALLAGLMQAPSRLAPTRNPDLADKRMHLVVQAMVENGYLSPAQGAAITAPRLDVRKRTELPTGTYFADWALPQARRLTEGGYLRQTVTTTLDARLQAAARSATRRAAARGAQVALVAMRPNGEVVAMIGGTDYAASPFNRATQARRQPGSTFKLFLYLAALRHGWSPDDRIDNEPIRTGSYRPANASGTYSKSLTLQDAFAQSSNVAAVRLFGQVGDKAVIQMARDLGVTSPLARSDPSLALGTSTMTLLELTSAYAGVAGNRFPVVPTAFQAQQEGWFDRVLSGRKSLSTSEHDAIERLLGNAVAHGTGHAALLHRPTFGKTGTTQDGRDALFVGYAGDLVVGVWVGKDNDTPLKGIAGGGLPAQIWHDFMSQALHETAPPPRPPSVSPSGPVQPLDLAPDEDATDDPDSGVRLENGQAVVSTEIGGAPVDVRLGRDGVQLGGPLVDEVRSGDLRRLRERGYESWQAAQEQARATGRRMEEAARREEDQYDDEDGQ